MTTKTTTTTTAAAPAAAPMASTTSASAFEAARGRGHFGRYGFDGIAQPLPSTPAPKTATRTASWMDRFYPDSFRPKSGLAKAMLLPVGMVMMAGTVLRPISGPESSEVQHDDSNLESFDSNKFTDELFSTSGGSYANGGVLWTSDE